MPDIPKGVAFNAPPTSLMADATAVLDAMSAQLPPDANGAIVAVATDAGWNAAIMHRVDNRWAVGAFVGKNWGSSVTGGGAIRATW